MQKVSALPAYRFLGTKRKGEGHPPNTFPQEGGLYQIQCQSVNTHRGKHRLGGTQLVESEYTSARKDYIHKCLEVAKRTK